MSATDRSGDLGWALSSRALHLILLPTERCNLRCTYCYEDFRSPRMKPETVRAVKRFLTARFPDLDRLDLGWFGGEPLAAVDLVLEVMTHVAGLKRSSPEVECSAEMTTNATLLTRSLARSLISLGVRRYQITLDGVAADHDAVRRRAGGRGTFAAVWKSLLGLRALRDPFTVLVRIHVSGDNHERLPALLAECAASLGGIRGSGSCSAPSRAWVDPTTTPFRCWRRPRLRRFSRGSGRRPGTWGWPLLPGARRSATRPGSIPGSSAPTAT